MPVVARPRNCRFVFGVPSFHGQVPERVLRYRLLPKNNTRTVDKPILSKRLEIVYLHGVLRMLGAEIQSNNYQCVTLAKVLRSRQRALN